jgi:uncharacterized protein YegL
MWRDEIFGNDTNKSKMLVSIILDKSGSMYAATKDTIGGFNSYIEKLQKDNKTDYLVSLTMFDTVFDIQYNAKPVKDVTMLDTSTYVANGNTALLDAVGKTIQEIPDDDPERKILVVIMTDGEENSSREFGWEGVQKLIKEKEAKGNWTFIYLGAMADAWVKGSQFGFSVHNVARYSHSNTSQVFGEILCNATDYLNTVTCSGSSSTIFADAGYATTDFSDGAWGDAPPKP